MNLRAWTVLSVAALSTACAVLEEDAASSSDEVVVTPTGTSTLGTLELVIPPSVAWKEGQRSLSILLDPVARPGYGDYASDEIVRTGGSVRLPPGTYCLEVQSIVGSGMNTLRTRDCSVEIPPAGKRRYVLGTVTFREEDVAFLNSQQTLGGGVTLLEPRSADGFYGRLWLQPNVFAAAKSTITTIVSTGRAVSWAPAVTEVPEGGAVALALPSEDRVVRFSVGRERPTLPDAFPNGMKWRLVQPPAYLSGYDQPRTAEDRDLTFFTDERAEAVFDLGGVEKRYPLAEVKKFTVFGRRLEVADVEDTDDEGTVTRIRGVVSVRVVDGPSLRWGSATTFSTGTGVWVWPGKYDVRVTYHAVGQTKTYEERVNVP